MGFKILKGIGYILALLFIIQGMGGIFAGDWVFVGNRLGSLGIAVLVVWWADKQIKKKKAKSK